MPLFNEEEVIAQDQHERLEIKDLEIGDSIGFYFYDTKSATSADYGDFIVALGLKVDLSASSVDAFIESASLASFIPNTLLLNKIDNSEMIATEVYRIEKAWDRGQKFSDNKRAKGWGYKVFNVDVGAKVRNLLNDRYEALKNPLRTTEAETDNEIEQPGFKKPSV